MACGIAGRSQAASHSSSAERHLDEKATEKKEQESMAKRGLSVRAPSEMFANVYDQCADPIGISSADEKGYPWTDLLLSPPLAPHDATGATPDPQRFDKECTPKKPTGSWKGVPVHTDGQLVSSASFLVETLSSSRWTAPASSHRSAL